MVESIIYLHHLPLSTLLHNQREVFEDTQLKYSSKRENANKFAIGL
jgi:hypothetical protein